MQFPFELTRAQTSVSEDLSKLPLHSEYIACFGKCKSLAELDKFSELSSVSVNRLFVQSVTPRVCNNTSVNLMLW